MAHTIPESSSSKSPPLTDLTSKYASVPEDIIFSNFSHQPVEYTDDLLKLKKIWSMPTNLEPTTLSLIAKEFLKDLTEEKCNALTPLRALFLAMHLRSTEKDSEQSCLQTSWQVQDGNDFPIQKIYINKESRSTISTMTSDKLREVIFLAAYSLRLLVNPVTNLSFHHLKLQYSSFYRGRPKFPNLTISTSKWTDFKAALSYYPEVQTTWVRTIAEAEYRMAATSNDMEMVRCIGCKVFSYSGMHAYSLPLEIMSYSKQSNRWWLESMCIPQTAPALGCIETILTKYEYSTEMDRKPTYFKYARLFGPEFFMPLQTKECLSLVYLEVEILTKYKSFADGQGPRMIVGLEKLAAPHKAFLTEMAKLIFEAAQGSL